MLAGIGAGVYRDVDDALHAVRRRHHLVIPEPDAAVFYDAYFTSVYRQLYDALRPLNHRIHALIEGSDLPVA